MAHGGARAGAGRKKLDRVANPKITEKVLRDLEEELLWKALFFIEMHRLGIDLTKSDLGASTAPKNVSIIPMTNLLDRAIKHARGNPVDTVNHLHDKPIDVNMTLSLAQVVREVRERKQEYERRPK